MQAKALICDEKQNFSISDVNLAEPGPGDVVIRTTCTGVSIGTEFALIRNKISWGPYPLCTGYQGVGVLEKVGSAVEGFQQGQKIYFRHNRRMHLADGTPVSGVSGTHCSHAVVDMLGEVEPAQVALLPEDVDEAAASSFVMPAVGLHGVDLANPRTGDVLVVHGAGLIGLGVIGAAAPRGCEIVAVDISDDRLDIARKMGADHVINSSKQDITESLAAIAPDGADVVFEATGIPECIDVAIPMCREFGTFVLQGNYGAETVGLHFLPAHGRQLTILCPCDDGQESCRLAVMKNLASGALLWGETITHTVEPADAAEFYTKINTGQANDVIGAVIHWS